MELDSNKIVFQSKDTTTTIRPDGEKSELITKAIQNITETGLPSNEDLDQFGDEIIQFFKESKRVAKDDKSKQIVDAARKVIEDVQVAVHERNYDEKIQEISKKLKDETVVTVPVTDEDSEIIVSSFREMGPSLMSLGRSIIQDIEFRKLIVAILDALSGAYTRVKDRLDERPPLMEVLKEDIQDVENPGVSNTRVAINKSIVDVGKYTEITKEEKEKIINRAYKALVKLRNKEDYKLIFENMFKIFDQVIDIWYRMNKTPTLRNVYGHETVLTDIKILIERSCGRSLDTWLTALERFSAIKNDKRYLKIRFGLESLIVDRKGKYQTKDKFADKLTKIRYHINELNENFNEVFKDVIMETSHIIYGISNDPVITNIKDSINNLIMEIFVDESGKPSVNAVTNSLIRIKDTFFPIIKEKISTLSLPIIELDSKKYFFRISDFKIHIADILPEQMRVESDVNVQIDFAKLKRHGDFRVKITLEPINTDVEGLKFYIKKKKGIKYKDYGTVDIYLKDSSIFLEFHIKLKKDKVDYIEVDKVSTNLKGLKIKIRDAKHDVLDKVVMTVFLPMIRSRLEKQLNQVLTEKINGTVCDRINTQLKVYELKKKNIKLKKGKHLGKDVEIDIERKRKVEHESPVIERRDTSPEKMKEKIKVKRSESSRHNDKILKVKKEVKPNAGNMSPVIERRVLSPKVVRRDTSPEKIKVEKKIEIEKDHPSDKYKEMKHDLRDFKREKDSELGDLARAKKSEKHIHIGGEKKKTKVEEKIKRKDSGDEIKYEVKKKVE